MRRLIRNIVLFLVASWTLVSFADPPQVVFWGDPDSQRGEIRTLQQWLPEVVANRFPPNSLVIVSHGNQYGQPQIPDAPDGYLWAVPRDGGYGASDAVGMVRSQLGGRTNTNTWLAWCNSGTQRGCENWPTFLSRQFPGNNFYSFQDLLRIVPGRLSGPARINSFTFDPRDADSTAILYVRSPRVFRDQTDASGAPIEYVPLGGPRGQRIVGTGGPAIGRVGNSNQDIATGIELPPNVIVRFATGAEESNFFDPEVGHLGTPGGGGRARSSTVTVPALPYRNGSARNGGPVVVVVSPGGQRVYCSSMGCFGHGTTQAAGGAAALAGEYVVRPMLYAGMDAIDPGSAARVQKRLGEIQDRQQKWLEIKKEDSFWDICNKAFAVGGTAMLGGK